MAVAIDEVAYLTNRLQNLPIYRIFRDCRESNNLTALQFMCILDFHTNRANLYARINESGHPKLLGQLLKFSQFETFKYYDCQVKRQFGNRVLQCRYCELIGPCGCILTHMTINHGVHTGVATCVFCKREKLRAHIDNNSLEECYQEYIKDNEIRIRENLCVIEIVADFYEMLKKLCEKLKLCSVRKIAYAGLGHKSTEKLARNYGNGIAQKCVVRRMISKKQQNRSIHSQAFIQEFMEIMLLPRINYDGPTIQPSIDPPDEIVVEIDSDEAEEADNEVNNATQNNNVFTYGHPSPGEVSIDDVLPVKMKHEPRLTDSPTSSVSPFPIPIPDVSNVESSRPPTNMSISSSYRSWSSRDESETFAQNIARKLEKIPQGNLRRQLEINIEVAILNTEKIAMEKGLLQ